MGLYFTEGKEQLLDDTQKWLDTVICVVIDEYKAKESEIVLGFGELGKTPMLVDHKAKKTAKKGAMQHFDDDESSVMSIESEVGSLANENVSMVG